MDDRDIFVALEANIIDAVKKLVQNARLEFHTRAQKGKIASSPSAAKSPNASASMKVSLPAKTVAKPTEASTPKKEAPKEPGNMMDVFASVLPPSEDQPPSETPPLVQSSSTEGGEPVEIASTTPVEETAAGLSAEEEAKKQFLEDLALDVDGDLHGMAHMRKPAMARRKTHAGTSSRFDPNAPALPEPAVVALVPEPTEQERLSAKASSMANPRQPMVNLADLQKRGGARAGGPGRGGGMAGRPVDSLPSSITDHGAPMRRQTSVDSSRPRQAATESHRVPLESHRAPLESHKTVELPKEPAASQPAQPSSPPPEPAKLPDLTAEGAGEAPALPQVVVSTPDAEAPPLPSLPASTPLSPLRTSTAEPSEPEHLSLDSGSARRNSGASAPDPSLSGAKSPVAAPKAPGPRSAVPGPAPPPGHPHHPSTPGGHHVPGPAPPPGRAMSPGPRKVSTGAPPPNLAQAPGSPTPLEVQVDGEYPPPIPVSTPSAEGEAPPPSGDPVEPEKKVSAVMNAARAKQPIINLADLTKPRTPKVDSGKPSTPAAAAGPAVPKCAECGCAKFVMNPFKKGTNCSTCFHQHPAA